MKWDLLPLFFLVLIFSLPLILGAQFFIEEGTNKRVVQFATNEFKGKAFDKDGKDVGFYEWPGAINPECASDFDCRLNSWGKCCSTGLAERPDLVHFGLGGRTFLRKEGTFCVDCSIPRFGGATLGPLYRVPGQNAFSLKGFVRPEGQKEGVIAGDHYPSYQDAAKEFSVSVKDQNTPFSELEFSVGETRSSYVGGLEYAPTPSISQSSLPLTKEFWIKVKNKGTGDKPAGSSEAKVSATLCPRGEIDIIKSGSVLLTVSGGTFDGIISFSIIEGTLSVEPADCFPLLLIVLEFKGVDAPIMRRLYLEGLKPLEAFDIQLKTSEGEGGNNGDAQGKEGGGSSPEGYWLIRELKTLIEENNMHGSAVGQFFSGIESDIKIIISVREKGGKFFAKVLQDGRVTNHNIWPRSDEVNVFSKPIGPFIYSLGEAQELLFKVLVNIGKLKDSFDPAKFGISESEQEAVSGILVPEGEMKKEELETTYEGFPAKTTSWTTSKGGGTIAKKYTKVDGKPYLEFHLYEPAFRKGKGKFDLTFSPFSIEGKGNYDKTGKHLTADVSFKTGVDIASIVDVKNFLNCCPKVKKVADEVIQFKKEKKGEVPSKSNSVYFIREEFDPFSYEGIAYQFFPAFDFSQDVTKQFDIQYFKDPSFLKEEDSFLDQCSVEVVQEVRGIISAQGGEISLPDDQISADTVGAVKQIFPSGAVPASREFGIRQLRVFNCGCLNGKKDPGESGFDCGGNCGPCEETCVDGIKNRDEIGVDVGGICTLPNPPQEAELCGIDENRNGVVQPCVRCAEEEECKSRCSLYAGICRGGNCECSEFLPQSPAVFWFISSSHPLIDPGELLGLVKDWLSTP